MRSEWFLLEKEKDAARNVKNHTNRTLILQALTAALHLLSPYAKTDIPATGLVIFTGGEDTHRFILIPPQPILKNTYLCDKRFHTELVQDLFEPHQETVGYIIVHGEDALFATVCGTRTTLLGTTIGHLHSDTRRGGQSAPRFGRIAEGRRDNYAKRIGERALELFGPLAPSSQRVHHRMVLGGPTGIKNRVLKSWNSVLPQPIVITLSRGGEEGLRECMEKADTHLTDHRERDDAALLQEFYFQLERSPDALVVGNEIAVLYQQGLLKSIWTTDMASLGPEFELAVLELEEAANTAAEINAGEPDDHEAAPEAGRRLRFGTRLFVVSANTELGTRFEREFMGLAAISWTA